MYESAVHGVKSWIVRDTANDARRAVGAPADMGKLNAERIVVDNVRPAIDGGRYAIKREVGAALRVEADIFREGHDVLCAAVKYRCEGETEWREVPMTSGPNDRWSGTFQLDRVGRFVYVVEAWTDTWTSRCQELRKKADAGQDVASELLEMAELLRAAAERAAEPEWRPILSAVQSIETAANQADAVRAATAAAVSVLMSRWQERQHATVSAPELHVVVDRERARFAAWYEFFPRSQAPIPGKHGTFRDCIRRLPDIQAMGFDVVYLPPIHPIGMAHRKGKNNSLQAGPTDVGSPWAVGNEHGGHDAVEPALGTLEDFRAFVVAAREYDIEVALDFAIQCSPDHPYVQQHPEWFKKRPDGSIKYAENPPKKYQDIYPIDFDSEAWQALWQEWKRVLLFWVEQGVTTFRVDNPHTKPVHFWEWVIAEVKRLHPGVVFLSEAFTRPKMMKVLAKVGFSQSYTYFTWRNGKHDLTEYVTELTQTEMAEYYRGNFFANTPDILHAYLQHGGKPAFKIRALLAATLSSVYGIYSGFEFCENTPLHEGSEEYLNSEKYEVRFRDWNAPGSIKGTIASINRARRTNPALQLYDNVHFHATDNENVLCYSKVTPDAGNAVLVVINLDPHRAHEAWVDVDAATLRMSPEQSFRVHDVLTGSVWNWKAGRNWVRLDPRHEPGHLLVVRR